jgi:hypothetical protein
LVFCCCFGKAGFEFSALCLLGRHSPPGATHPFWRWGLSFCTGDLGHNPLILSFLLLLQWQAPTTTTSFFPLSRVLQTFLPGLAWNHRSLGLSLPSS